MTEQTFKEMLGEVHEGQEVWTDNLPELGERVVVGIGIEEGEVVVIHWGESHKITEEQARLLLDEFFVQEFGTTDLGALLKAGVI